MPYWGSMSRRKNVPTSRQTLRAADSPTAIAVLWPIVLGVLVTFLMLRVADMLTLMGSLQFAVVYPWVELVKYPALGIQCGSAVVIGQVLLYLQYPIYGLIAGIVLYASNSVVRAFFTVFSVHLVALILFIAVSILHPS